MFECNMSLLLHWELHWWKMSAAAWLARTHTHTDMDTATATARPDLIVVDYFLHRVHLTIKFV